MKRILGIVGSPRKNGNTHVLVSRILEGARCEGADAETVLLGDLQIGECNGCHACWKGNHVCSKHDDMTLFYSRIPECDVIVFGTPVYWYGPSAIMKCLIDRFVYFNCPGTRKGIANKTAVIVVPFEEEDYRTSELVVRFFEKSLGYLQMDLVEKVLVPGVTKRGEVRARHDIMNRCFALGQALAAGK